MKLPGTVIVAVLISCGAPAIRAGAEDPKRATEEAKREAAEAKREADEAKREAEDDKREAEEERQKRDAKRAREAEEARKERDEDLPQKIRQKVDTKLFRSPEERAYRRGLEYLDGRRWEKAIEAFDEVLGITPPAPPAPPVGPSGQHKMPPGAPMPAPMSQWKGPRGPLTEHDEAPRRTDAALYWKAYALHKLGRRGDALAAIETIRKDHPQSGWLVQAKMLEVEVKQAAGQAPSPEGETDDELKLIALNALAKTDPERAVPLLEKIVTGPATPGLQERALFVLAQSGSPRAREITARIVRGPSNPDLQMNAIRSLAAMGGDESHAVLADAYRRSSTVEVKKAILESLSQAGAHDQVAALVRSETDPELLTAAVRSLMQGPRRLKLRDGESSAGTGIADDRLVALYSDKVDARVRREIVEILAERGNAHAVVALARKEKNADLKREIVQRLSRMNDKEATEYLLEILSK